MAQEARQDPLIGQEDATKGGPVVDPLPTSDDGESGKLIPVLKTAGSSHALEDAPAETSAPVGTDRLRKAHPERRPLLERIARVVLTLTLVSIVGFIAGAALAGSILSGLIDLETGWVKDSIKLAKELMHYLKHR